MRASLILICILIECIFSVYSYKLIYDEDDDDFSDEDYLAHKAYKRFQTKNDLDRFLYKSNNFRQPSWYDSVDEDHPYTKALDALALDEFINSPPSFDDDFIETRDEESESHSSLVGGHQYVSGGAGEGKQHLSPDGKISNKEEIKSDEDLPAYCDPPNPCPIGYTGEDCDPRPFTEFTAEYSKNYQEQQSCMCDEDHNECSKSVKTKSVDKINELIQNIKDIQLPKNDKFSPVVAKKSPRIRRSTNEKASKKNETKSKKNPFLSGQAIKVHVAKKSAPI
ncbi:unnamed protein product [Brachionus calyciflorus]|uniref:Neuroendocrine protein 7B2 n=1 Tax=Brachionus calyciflorus TaxID=104777 RepID=A0A813SNA6_9BILA|nr:unnamed protein product [Brachionus calyciflorus]